MLEGQDRGQEVPTGRGDKEVMSNSGESTVSDMAGRHGALERAGGEQFRFSKIPSH